LVNYLIKLICNIFLAVNGFYTEEVVLIFFCFELYKNIGEMES
jgi:uncharacterized membrane protein